MTFPVGTPIAFYPRKGSTRQGVVCYDFSPQRNKTLIRLVSDPLDVYVRTDQLKKVEATVPTATIEAPVSENGAKPKRTRRTAKPDVIDLTDSAPVKRGPGRPRKDGSAPQKATTARKRVAKAPVAEAPVVVKRGPGRPRKDGSPPVPSAPKRGDKAKAARKVIEAKDRAIVKARAKAAVPKITVNGDTRATDNPFRIGCNSYIYTEMLKQGGKRSALIRRIKSKVQLHPWTKSEADIDVDYEIDQRLILVANKLSNLGWKVEKGGRGRESTIKVYPPSRRKA